MEQKFVYPVPADLEVIDVAEHSAYPIDSFYVPARFKPYIDSIILPDGVIKARWARLAERILADYAGETELVILVLMNGGYQFFEDLKAQLNAQMAYAADLNGVQSVLQIRPYFVKLSSYEDTESTGQIKGVEHLAQVPLHEKNVLIVEDMIDTGTTMKAVLQKIRSDYEPKSLKTCIAFHKKTPKNVAWGYVGDYTGFLVDDSFVIGYGLDYNEHFRDLSHLCIINQHGIDTFKKSK